MKVAVFFGGRSCEHDISIITAVQVMAHLCTDYEVFPIYMKEGAYYTGDVLRSIDFYVKSDLKQCQRLWLLDGAFYGRMKSILIKKFRPDVALICCHGGEGENGVLQGVLEFNKIPYTSAGVLASSVAMDKVISKEICNGLMLNTVDEISVFRDDYLHDADNIFRHIETYLEYPMIVKPANLGSSIGIKRANNREELKDAMAVACGFDRKIIIENALTDFTELNCAVVSDGEITIVSEIERPLSWSDFLTFEDKYMGGEKGMGGEKRELPAKIPSALADTVREISARLYQDLDMVGVVRIDYLLSKEGKLFVNEVNTVPGSMSFYLFEPLGISFSRLLDMLIAAALKRYNDHKKSRLAYNSGVLKNLSGGVGVKQLPNDG